MLGESAVPEPDVLDAPPVEREFAASLKDDAPFACLRVKRGHWKIGARIPILEGSARARSGRPLDEEDLSNGVWAGVLPLAISPGAPVPDPLLAHEVPVSQSIVAQARALGDNGCHVESSQRAMRR